MDQIIFHTNLKYIIAGLTREQKGLLLEMLLDCATGAAGGTVGMENAAGGAVRTENTAGGVADMGAGAVTGAPLSAVDETVANISRYIMLLQQDMAAKRQRMRDIGAKGGAARRRNVNGCGNAGSSGDDGAADDMPDLFATAENAAVANTAEDVAEEVAENIAEKAAEKAEKAGKYVWEHRRGFAIAAAILLMLAFLLNGLSSCSVIMDGVGSGIAASTYPSQDADMLGAEAQYCEMEAELQRYLDTYESTHDYDEYHFDLDTIEHDPYVLISMITALHQGEWTLDEVQGTLQMLFDRQYILTEDVVVETRYRTETDTWTDADGNTHTDTYQVPYDYYICTVTLENFNLSHVPVYIMSEEQLGMYATYMATLGNRPDLFPGSGYIGKYVEGSYTDYDIPPEALDDEVFAAIIKEAEKYLGFPYVWGGSSPSTSFDCSGFVSWVINHSGWDVGRLGAQGLCNICTPVSSANIKPGDLVFFTGTYDTPGVSHVGIYVGNNMMIHCGDPISYANLNSSYWQSHFYRYGRLP